MTRSKQVTWLMTSKLLEYRSNKRVGPNSSRTFASNRRDFGRPTTPRKCFWAIDNRCVCFVLFVFPFNLLLSVWGSPEVSLQHGHHIASVSWGITVNERRFLFFLAWKSMTAESSWKECKENTHCSNSEAIVRELQHYMLAFKSGFNCEDLFHFY